MLKMNTSQRRGTLATNEQRIEKRAIIVVAKNV
jgi:hypothetical protein